MVSMSTSKCLIIFSFAILQLLSHSGGVAGYSVEEVDSFTPNELAALKEFRSRVESKIPETSVLKNISQDDLYMIRWLRAKNLKVKAAEAMFLNHLGWRQSEDVENILDENFSDILRECPLFNNATAKNGAPGEWWLGEWDLRKIAIAGKGQRIQRRITQELELYLRRQFQARAEGKPVEGAYVIVELEGFSTTKNICPACLPIYVTLANLMEMHYPFVLEKIIYANTPQHFHVILRLVKTILSPHTRNAINTYVTKDQWLPALDAITDRDQRSKRFEGTIKREF